MTAILGLSAYYHDASAALVIDGRIVASAQEERFSRIKHDPSFPNQAISYCRTQARLATSDLEYVVCYEKPSRKLERLIDTWLAFAPRGYRAFLRAVPSWMGVKLHLSREISRSLGSVPQHRLTFVQHHESHAASAFFPSPFTRAALLTLDGVGEWATATIGVGDGNRLEILFEQRFPHSLGLLYAAFTHLAGFRINSGEYKLMGLAPYGQPRFVPTIMDNLIDLRADGSFRLDLSYFDFAHGSTMTSKKFHRLFEGPARQPEAPITQREKDLAASIQAVTQEIVLRCARHLHQHTGEKNVCLAGGVALNCVANGWLRSHGPFERVWVQPASGDAGGALGAALFVWHQLLSQPRIVHGGDTMQGALLGPCFSDDELEAFLQSKGLRFQRYPDDRSLCERVADLLEQQAVIGWFQGRMEYGPRALGNRSIVADPRSQQHRDTLNLKIKFRESFRPFAPSVLAERAHEWFDVPIGYEDPYMLFVVNVRGDVTPLPAVTHIDGTARVQTVDGRHGRYRLLLEAFAERTGCPVLVNTSFNVRGEPIVCTPADAYGCFLRTNLDVLVLGRCVVVRDEQVDVPRHTVAPTGQFPLD